MGDENNQWDKSLKIPNHQVDGDSLSIFCIVLMLSLHCFSVIVITALFAVANATVDNADVIATTALPLLMVLALLQSCCFCVAVAVAVAAANANAGADADAAHIAIASIANTDTAGAVMCQCC